MERNHYSIGEKDFGIGFFTFIGESDILLGKDAQGKRKKMSGLEQKDKNDFLIEKIKERPVNKRKLIRRTIITAAMAVIFGLIACFTFLVLEPVISNWLYPEEEPQPIVFPEDQEEMSPEEMLSDNMQAQNQEESRQETEVVLEEEQIESILSQIQLDKEDYRQLYSAMSEFVSQLNESMVTVTGVTSNIDWFNNVQESQNQSFGVIIANNGRELLVLADNTPISDAQELSMEFYNGVQVKAQVKQKDSFTNLAVLSVSLNDLPQENKEDLIKVAVLGSSNAKNIVGTPVIAMGSPMGISNSVGYGMITAVNSQLFAVDRNYKLLFTDISGSRNGGGVLFNLQGQVIGIITSEKAGSDMTNVIGAYGITELKKVIEKMSNGESVAYLGVSGVDVTQEAHEELGVPYGAYVREVDMDSPAMLAGIQQGDVIVAIDDRTIVNFGEYSTVLLQMEAGDQVNIQIMRQAQNEYREMNFSIVLGTAE